MYCTVHWTVQIHEEDEEIVKEIYNAQKISPTDGDYSKLVEADKIELNISLEDIYISKMKQRKYKSFIKTKVKESALKNLLLQKSTHTKMSDIKYTKLEIQPYLNSPLFGSEQAQMLLALRTRTVRGIKADFKGMFTDLQCPLGCGNADTIQNLSTCTVIQKHFKTEAVTADRVDYEHLFGADIKKQKEATEMFTQLLNIREQIINNNIVEPTGPCIDLQRLGILST